jgi:hypothetical protein
VTSALSYVYCIVASSTPLQTTKMPAGLPGAGPVRAVEITRGRYLVVSDAPESDFGEGALTAKLSDLDWVSRAAVAHEAVTESFLPSADAVVPLKLFTLFSSDERALAQIRSGFKRVESVIKRLNKHEEWGVRLVFDQSRAPSAADAAASPSGRNYLLAKRAQQTASAKQSTAMRKVAGDVLKSLRPLSRDVRQRPITAPPESRSRLLLDAAFLVPRAKAPRFRKSVEQRAKKIAAAGYALQLTGPWPAYSFVEN